MVVPASSIATLKKLSHRQRIRDSSGRSRRSIFIQRTNSRIPTRTTPNSRPKMNMLSLRYRVSATVLPPQPTPTGIRRSSPKVERMPEEKRQFVSELTPCGQRDVDQYQLGAECKARPYLSRRFPQQYERQHEDRGAEDQIRGHIHRPTWRYQSGALGDRHEGEYEAHEREQDGVNLQAVRRERAGQVRVSALHCITFLINCVRLVHQKC